MELAIQIGILIVSYLLGSIPTGLLLGKMKGIDIRNHGSKNIGSTNVGRVLGRKYAIITYMVDMFKGAIFVALFRYGIIDEKYCLLHPLLYGLAAAIGHTSSIYLKFRGGKAVATSSGVLFAYCPWAMIPTVLVFFLTTYLTSYVSAGSIAGCIVTLILSIVLASVGKDPFLNYSYNFYFPLFIGIITLLVIIRHKSNITRIINKTEAKVKWGLKK